MPTLSRSRAAAAASLVVASLLLGGCGLNRPAASETPTGIVVSPIASETKASATPSLPPAAELPAGQQWVTTAGHGVKFAVPGTWAMFDLTSFNEPGVKEALAPLAEKLGKSVDAYVAELTGTNDLIVTGPTANGYTPTLSVRKEEAQTLGDAPTMEQAQAGLGSVQGTVSAVTPLTTALGPGYAIVYSSPAETAGLTLYRATVGLPTMTGTAFLMAIESNTAAERDALVAGVAATLQKA